MIIQKIIYFFKNIFKKKRKSIINNELYPPYDLNDFDLLLLNAINVHRVKIGVDVLEIDIKLSAVSNSHTQRMIRDQFVSHNGAVDRQKSYPNSMMSEIVGYGYKSADGFLNGWINSPSHKVALEKKTSTKIGIASSIDSKGNIYATIIFIN